SQGTNLTCCWICSCLLLVFSSPPLSWSHPDLLLAVALLVRLSLRQSTGRPTYAGPPALPDSRQALLQCFLPGILQIAHPLQYPLPLLEMLLGKGGAVPVRREPKPHLLNAAPEVKEHAALLDRNRRKEGRDRRRLRRAFLSIKGQAGIHFLTKRGQRRQKALPERLIAGVPVLLQIRYRLPQRHERLLKLVIALASLDKDQMQRLQGVFTR